MENILHTLVKIIIIGLLYDKTNVDCNRQFLPQPPLPYYQNEGFYVPGLSPAYHNQVPIYYREQIAAPNIPYQDVNSYTRPQLFYQNDNFVPPPAVNPRLRHPSPHAVPYKDFSQSDKVRPKLSYGVSQVNYKKPAQPLVPQVQEVSQKKPEAFASNIIVKEEPPSPYYQDDYSKNYQDEDYIDNYSDESPIQQEPCLASSPYRFFEAPKRILNKDNKYSLCNLYYSSNFGNGVYTVKAPITLLPSRFPPRIEQLIERIQNYFSTYTQQQSSKPQNETSPVFITQTTTETLSENVTQSSVAEEDVNENKTTEKNQEQTNSEAATVEGVEQVQAVTAEIEVKELQTPSTTATSSPVKKESQMDAQTTLVVSEVTESVPGMMVPREVQKNEEAGASPHVLQEEINSFENQTMSELNYPKDEEARRLEGELQPMDITV